MRVEISISLPEDLLSRLDDVDKNRSAVLERAAIAYLFSVEKRGGNPQDIEIINRNAERLNEEAADALEYQERW